MSLNKVITDLKTELQKARAMLKDEEESKARAVDDMAKKNASLANQFPRSEAEQKRQESNDAKRAKAEIKVVEDKDEGSTAFLEEAKELKMKIDTFLEEDEPVVEQAGEDAREYENRNQTQEVKLEYPKGETGLKNDLQGMEGESKQASHDVETEIKNQREKVADQDEQKKDPKRLDEKKEKLKRDNVNATKRINEGKPNQDDQKLQGPSNTTPEPHSSPSQVALGLRPDATLSSSYIAPESPAALTLTKLGHSTSNISPQTFPADIQSAPPASNNRVDMFPTAGILHPLDTNTPLPTAPMTIPVASPDPLGLSMSNSSYASHYSTNKAPLTLNSTDSSVDRKNNDKKKAEKEKPRRSSEDTRPRLTLSRTSAKPPHEGSALNPLDHTMRHSGDNRIPTGRIGKKNRRNTDYNQDKRRQEAATRLSILDQGRKAF